MNVLERIRRNSARYHRGILVALVVTFLLIALAGHGLGSFVGYLLVFGVIDAVESNQWLPHDSWLMIWALVCFGVSQWSRKVAIHFIYAIVGFALLYAVLIVYLVDGYHLVSIALVPFIAMSLIFCVNCVRAFRNRVEPFQVTLKQLLALLLLISAACGGLVV